MRIIMLAAYAGFLLGGMALFMTGSLQAGELDVQPRLNVGVMDYSFESEAISVSMLTAAAPFNSGTTFTQQAFEYNGQLSFVGSGVTLFYRRFFLDLSTTYAFDGQGSDTINYAGYAPISYDSDSAYLNTAYLAAEPEYEARFHRSELAASLGYALGKQCSVFAGYKWAVTEFDTAYIGPYRSVNYDTNGDIDGTSSGRVWGDAQFSFQYGGPFFGAVQGWEIQPFSWFKGVVSANLALAYLHGKVTLDNRNGFLSIHDINGESAPEETRSIEGGGVANRLDTAGDSLGLTLSIGWHGATPWKGLAYRLGVSGYRYEFDAKDNGQSDINETAVVYQLGMTYLF